MSYMYIGCCVDNPFDDVDTLIDIIDEATDISMEDFFSKIPTEELQNLDLWGEPAKDMIEKFPNSFTFHKTRDNILFFVNSAIEFFFKEDPY